MNRKGFTLIELLAVIVIMSIVLIIAIPSSIDAYKKSRLKAEDVFVKRLSEQVDSYITLNVDKLRFNSNVGTKIKPDSNSREVTVYQDTIIVQDLINEKLISKSDYINPNNKKQECNINAQIKIYKDSDLVYCHKIEALSLDCLTDDYIEFIEEQHGGISNGNPFVVDTCVWRDR